jgi:hypothetical protein
VNILFVNYGDFTTNSLNHIGGFARVLAEEGHSCAVAVPSGKDTLSAVTNPAFTAVLCDEVLAGAQDLPGRRDRGHHPRVDAQGMRAQVRGRLPARGQAQRPADHPP